MDRIFEVSYSANPLGTGLGLSIVRGLVEKAGGQLQLESEVSVGSVVRIILPEIPAPEKEVETLAHAATALPFRELNVLVVDDDETVRRVIVRSIEEHGHTAIPACSGPDALAIAARLEHPVDIVVSDLAMPGMNGVEVALSLKNLWPNVQVLFISGNSPNPDFRDEASLSEASFIAKPFTPERLLRELESLAAENSMKH